MRDIRPALRRLLVEEDGPTTPEYAVLLCLIIVALIAAIEGLRDGITRVFESATDAVQLSGT
jgi:Flp pilus assembly pilin Flp